VVHAPPAVVFVVTYCAKKAATTTTFHMTFLVLRFAWPLNCEEHKRRPIAAAAGGGWVGTQVVVEMGGSVAWWLGGAGSSLN